MFKQIAMLMLVLSILAGCSSNNAQTNNSSDAETDGTSSNTNEELEPVELVWYLRMSEPNNAESVLAKFNEMVKEKINATVDFRFVNPGDYNDKMQLVMSSGEQYDLVFTSYWANTFTNNVSRGAYLPIDEYLDQYPTIKEMHKEEIWEAVNINGHYYGIPNLQIMANQPGIAIRKDLADKYGIDVSSIQSFADLTPALQTIKDNEEDIIPYLTDLNTVARDAMVPFQSAVEQYFAVDTDQMKVDETFEQEVMLERYKLLREWNEKGFVPVDAATMKNGEELMQSGKVFARYNRTKPGNEAELKLKYNYEFYQVPIGDPVIERTAVQSTITAISATSEHPERAIMLYDLLLKDKELYNTLIYGLEGQDYNKVDDNRIDPIDNGYYVLNWQIGSVFNSYLIPGQDDDIWEQTKSINDNAIIDPLIGFNFDREPVRNEMARISAINSEYQPIFQHGLKDPEEALIEKQAKLETAGIDSVIEEINNQLAEWSK